MSQLDTVRLPDAAQRAHPPEHAAPHARDHAPAGQHPPQGRLGARLRAVLRRRDADVRRGRGPPQRHRHHRRLDGAARRRRRRQGLLHHRPADQRDGDEGGADGRADHRLAQRRHGHGPRTGRAAGHDAVRPRRQPALPLLHRLRALRLRARAAARACAWSPADARRRRQTSPSNSQTSTASPAATEPCSWPSTTSALASLMLRRMPAPCEPVSRTCQPPSGAGLDDGRAGIRCAPAACGWRWCSAPAAPATAAAWRRPAAAGPRARRHRT